VRVRSEARVVSIARRVAGLVGGLWRVGWGVGCSGLLLLLVLLGLWRLGMNGREGIVRLLDCDIIRGLPIGVVGEGCK